MSDGSYKEETNSRRRRRRRGSEKNSKDNIEIGRRDMETRDTSVAHEMWWPHSQYRRHRQNRQETERISNRVRTECECEQKSEIGESEIEGRSEEHLWECPQCMHIFYIVGRDRFVHGRSRASGKDCLDDRRVLKQRCPLHDGCIEVEDVCFVCSYLKQTMKILSRRKRQRQLMEYSGKPASKKTVKSIMHRCPSGKIRTVHDRLQ